MKRKNLRLLTVCLLMCLVATSALRAQTYDKLWAQVNDAQVKGLPQTALSVTENIIRKAEAEKNSGQLLKAYTARMDFRNAVTPDSFYLDLASIEKWITTETDQVSCAILHTLLAQTYSDYASRNRWRLHSLTDLNDEADAGDDIRQWSENLFMAKVKHHVTLALEDVELLLGTSSKAYEPFTTSGSTSGYYNHDMLHLLTKKAIEALNNISSFDERGKMTSYIVSLRKRLIDVYAQKGNRRAVLLARLDSLSEHRNYWNDSACVRKLDEIIAANTDLDVVTEAYLMKANTLNDDNDYVNALAVVDEAMARYPRYERINALRNLRQDILSPELSVRTPMACPGKSMEMRVSHRNLSGLTVEVYALNLETTDPKLYNTSDFLNGNDLKKHLRKHSSTHFDLKRTTDYTEADTILNLPTPANGLYAVRVVPDAKSATSVYKLFSSSRLKMLSHKLPNGNFEVVVLDAISGHPVPGAKVRIFSYKKGEREEAKALTTGADGRATTPWDDAYRYIVAQTDTDRHMMVQGVSGGYYIYKNGTDADVPDAMQILTDRAIYRPGQTIYVKGIAYTEPTDTSHVIGHRNYNLSFRDANRREIATRAVTTNEFGSFTTEFTIPTGGLNGTYYISTGKHTRTVSVEEYKRPTFDIRFDTLKQETFALGDTVTVRGRVKTFAGMPMNDVTVQYSITRWFRHYHLPGTGAKSSIIATDTVRTATDGSFELRAPLLSVNDTDGFEFSFKYGTELYDYVVSATVTSLAGETQSSQTTIPAGNTALVLNIKTPGNLDKNNLPEITFGAFNLNGHNVDASITYKVYKYADYEADKIDSTAVLTGTAKSNEKLKLEALTRLPSAPYMIVAESKDEKGRPTSTDARILLFGLTDKRPPVTKPLWVHEISNNFDARTPASFLVGTTEKDAYLMMDVFAGKERVETRNIHLSDTLMRIDYPYLPRYGGGVTMSLCLVRNDKVYEHTLSLTQTMPDKKLRMRWDVFRDKLRPGDNEEWQLSIVDAAGNPVDAELMATMYDAALNKLASANRNLYLYYHRALPRVAWMRYDFYASYVSYSFPTTTRKYPNLAYDDFWINADQLVNNMNARATGVMAGSSGAGKEVWIRGMSTAPKQSANVNMASRSVADVAFEEEEMIYQIGYDEPKQADGASVDVRTNFAETAFFYPQLRTDSAGRVKIAFTLPESLTAWHFQAVAHTRDMFVGNLEATATASKEFMLTSNRPRFVRVGDATTIAATIANAGEARQVGTATFTLFDPLTDKVITTRKQKFAVDAGQTVPVSFDFQATEKYKLLGCRIVAAGSNFSDGEQYVIPVLANKERIIEAASIFARPGETIEVAMDTLFNRNSRTATERTLTVELSTQPAWQAITALPSLALPQTDNAVTWASAYYANNLSAWILNADPRLRTRFEAYATAAGSEGLMSKLAQNQELKTMLLQETPWMLEAASEREQMERLASFFNPNQVMLNNITAINKLRDLQLADGSWSWYKGMTGSYYMTNYVLETLLRLKTLTGTPLSNDVKQMCTAAMNYLGKEAVAEHAALLKAKNAGKATRPSPTALSYIYLVALHGETLEGKTEAAYRYFIKQTMGALSKLSLREKAQAVVALKAAGEQQSAQAFVASLREYAITTHGMGMHFPSVQNTGHLADLPVATQVAVMEAFGAMNANDAALDEMKIWLLRQKEATAWKNPVATVNASYALLRSGSDLANTQASTHLNLRCKQYTPEALAQAETLPGYNKLVLTDDCATKPKGNAKVTNSGNTVLMGSVYASFSEDLGAVRSHGGELALEKKLYVERIEGTKAVLQPLAANQPLKVGDKVVARITIRAERRFDFVQLKDQRGACFEPIDSASGYRRAGVNSYYIDVKDAATHFFFERVEKGVHVLEHSYRVARAGVYQGGLATVQSAYAPGYAAHSESVIVTAE